MLPSMRRELGQRVRRTMPGALWAKYRIGPETIRRQKVAGPQAVPIAKFVGVFHRRKRLDTSN